MHTIQDCATAWEELNRVADHVFICVPPKTSVVAWIHPDHYLWVQAISELEIEAEDRHTGERALITASGEIVA